MDGALSRPASLHLARDVMTTPVVSAAPDTSVRDVARLLLDHRISAVPVMDAAGALLGMASEGDLLGRSAQDRLAGEEWWLAILSQPGQGEAAVTDAAIARPVRDVMHAPVVTVADDAPVQAVADAMRSHGIKRLPVVRGGQVVGIVTRADLLRVVEALPLPGHAEPPSWLAALFRGLFSQASPSAAMAVVVPDPAPAPVTAGAFRNLLQASQQGERDERKAAAQSAGLRRLQQVKDMLREHVDAGMWDTLLAHAQVVAAHGGKEMQLLCFPSGLCTDDGRKINNADPAWADTLRGEAAEAYARWESGLKPAGFGIAARVLTYPDCKPGDIGLFLVWAD